MNNEERRKAQEATLSKLTELLQVRRTKSELALALSTDERTIRRYISILSQRMPILSLSCQGGYRIATLDDREEIQHQINENHSRALKTLSRNTALRRLLEGNTGDMRQVN